jgi:hypothetical protein
MSESQPASALRHYFVDEAGDPMLFNRKKKSIVGEEGNSTYFVLGKVDVDDAATASGQLNELRNRLLSDPYFKDVPSM